VRLTIRTGANRIRGVTLIELMISMVLGLIVIGGATGVIIANQQSYRTNEALSQVQESARTAFELLARDVREAGATGCDSNGRVANVLNSGTLWWQTWFGIDGFDGAEADAAVSFGTGVAQRVSGTDSVLLQGATGTGLSIVSHVTNSAIFRINASTPDLRDNDILIVCDFDHAAIFQVSNYNSANVTVVHNDGNGSPGNCAKGLGYPTLCGPPANGNVYAFAPNSRLARLSAVDWYIGNNGRAVEGGRSLYRRRLGAGAAMVTEEVVAGVTDMQLLYRETGSDSFVEAGTIGTWTNVTAVTITLTMQSADQRVTTDTNINSGRLQRTLTNVVTLRNRVP
jgi:type IV pilus assembly protein PilW